MLRDKEKAMPSPIENPGNLPCPNTENNHRVIFEKPFLPDLVRAYTVVDLHFHSRHSDGSNSIDAIAERARNLGIGVAVTDHNTIYGALEIARKHPDVLSIPGIEVTSREGAHLLVYFYHIADLAVFYEKELVPWLGKNIMSSASLNLETIIARARKYEAVVVFPHPYSTMFTGVCNQTFSRKYQECLLAMADGIEVINAGNVHRWNLQSTVLAFNMNTGMTAGSDGHNINQMGRAVTYASCGRSATDFLDAIKEKRTWTMGKENGLLRKMTSNGIKIRTSFTNSADIFGKNVRYSIALINSGSRMLKDRVHGKLEKRRTRKWLTRNDGM